MIKTYTYKIKANKKFIEKFNQWAGTCRFLYNSALELKSTVYRSHGIKLSNYDICKQLTEAKKEIVWLNDVHSQTLQAVLDRLDLSYKKFFKGGGYPKFASRKKWKSIPFKSIKLVGGQFCLPKFGMIKVFKDRVPNGKLKTASLIKKADGYYLHITVEVLYENFNDSQVGIDMGLSHFAVTSDGEIIENPKHFKRYEKKLRILNRSLSRKKLRSNMWNKNANDLSLLYLKVSRVRRDFLHKESTKISKKYGLVFLEDLNVSGMSKNKNLSKHILDAGWSEFRTLLSYKSKVILVDPKYTSQKCNVCGHIDSRSRISQSEFVCTNCGNIDNADKNASLNIKSQGMALIREREPLGCA
jgi:putative transposase